MSPAPTAPQDPPPKRSASPTSFCPEPKKPKPDPPKTEKRTPEEKVAHAAARQAAWMAANGITGVPEGPLPVSTSDLDFGRGLFLAPMVRSGTVVNRLLALQYGADLVWSPEVVDRAIIGSERLVDERTGLVYYYVPDESRPDEDVNVFSTHPIEKNRLIFQLGSAHPAMAYHAIKRVGQDVAGVDLNCGCPKPFSTLGGMGSNLLTAPDLLLDILRAMRKAAPPHVSVTCKIRLLPSQEATLDLVRRIVHSGTVDAITVHCRTKEMRPREPALPDRLPEVIQAVREACKGGKQIPVVINGDVWDRLEAERLCAQTGTTSAMIARGAEANPSVFLPQALSVRNVVWPQLLRYALWLNNPWGNTKWILNASTLRPRLKRATESESKQARSEPVFSLPYAQEQPLTKSMASQATTLVCRAKAPQDVMPLVGIEDLDALLALPAEEVLKPLADVLRSKPPHTRSVRPPSEQQNSTPLPAAEASTTPEHTSSVA